jgi:predicted PurR-regulated permease PerM
LVIRPSELIRHSGFVIRIFIRCIFYTRHATLSLDMPERTSQPDETREAAPDSFARRATLASAIFVAFVFLALFLWYSVYVFFLLFAGVLLAIMLRAMADVVRRFTGLSHRWSLAIVLVVLAGLLVGLWFLAVPPLSKQAAALAEKLPEAWQAFQAKVRETPIGGLVMGQAGGGGGATTQPATQPTSQPTLQPAMVSASTGGGPGQLLGRFGGFLSTVMDLVAALLVVLFTGLFLAFDPSMYVRGAIRLCPPGYRVRFGAVLGAVGYTLKWWLIGQGITMLVIAIATSIGLWLLGVPLALVLGVLAGLFNFIPNFGPLFSMVPATLLALTVSPERAIGVIILFIVLQNLEGNLLTPLIQRKAVDLPPAIGIIAQILLGILVGAVGLILAWPIAAAAVLAVKMMYVEDVLGDEIPTPDDESKKEVRDAKREARRVEADEKKE